MESADGLEHRSVRWYGVSAKALLSSYSSTTFNIEINKVILLLYMWLVKCIVIVMDSLRLCLVQEILLPCLSRCRRASSLALALVILSVDFVNPNAKELLLIPWDTRRHTQRNRNANQCYVFVTHCN